MHWDKRKGILKLIGAIFVSGFAGLFVHAFSIDSNKRFTHEQPGVPLITANELLIDYAWIAYLFPIAITIAGFWTLHHGPQPSLSTDIIIVAAWVFSVVWICLAILTWNVQYVPIL